MVANLQPPTTFIDARYPFNDLQISVYGPPEAPIFNFHTHKLLLALISSFFRGMLKLPQPGNPDGTEDKLKLKGKRE
jgi:hypothetical protein